MAVKATTSKKGSKRLPHPAKWRMVILGTVLLVGLGLSLITVFKVGANHQRAAAPPVVASGTQIEQARTDIAKQYVASATTCDGVTTDEQVLTFYKYLRVNLRANRAVIRGCSNHDTLLAKIGGKWKPTNVQINLDQAVYPGWQEACDITDITRAQTTTTSTAELASNGQNYGLCVALQSNKIL